MISASGVKNGTSFDLEVKRTKETIDILTLSITKSKKGSKEIYEAFKGKYSYGQIRMVQAILAKGE